MNWRQGYIAVDWGTTNRRAYRVENGALASQFEDEQGLKAVSAGEFPEAVAHIRERLGDLPMLLAGMVGSKKGWREAPYIPCPAQAAGLAANILWMDDRTGIVPGVCQRGPAGADVMRGEEVQILGAIAAGLTPEDGLICHPGTHAKWIEIRDGGIHSFRTMMTGEVFGLLCAHSILSDLIAGEASAGPAFKLGVAGSLSGEPPLSALFRIRARSLLEADPNDAASRASGILIGSEVAWAVQAFPQFRFALIGRPELCELYAEAASLAGRETFMIDGAQAFLAGIEELTRMLG